MVFQSKSGIGGETTAKTGCNEQMLVLGKKAAVMGEAKYKSQK